MNKKTVIISLLVYIILFTGIANAYTSLQVDFSGVLVSTNCQVSADSIEKNIILNNIRWQNINNDIPSHIVPFYISIEKCSDTDLMKTIHLTWQSKNITIIGDEKYITSDGDTNILLGITDYNDNLVKWDEPLDVGKVTVSGNIQKIKFGVYARKPKDMNVNTGEFSGVANFKVEYE